MTVHMETVYAADKNVTSFDVSWNRMTVPWIVRMPRMSTSLDWTKLQIYLWMATNTAGISETRRMPVQPPYRIFPISRYFAQRRVLYFHDCAHGDGLRRRQECYTSFDVSGTARRCHG
jgi:hypothetical protein